MTTSEMSAVGPSASSTLYGHGSVPEFLRGELAARLAKNRAYSLRAFAKALGLAPSTLSEVLSGRIRLSTQKAYGVAQKLGLAGEQAEYFVRLAELSTAKSLAAREAIESRLRDLNRDFVAADLSVDRFRAMADWYHVAILEMAPSPELGAWDGGELTARLASDRLGISLIEAQAAIERLVRLEALERDERGRLRRTQGIQVVSSKTPDEGLRRFQQQMLARVSEAFETQPTGARVNATETFRGDPESLERVRWLTEDYIQKVLKAFRQAKRKTHIYHLGVHLIRVTREHERKK